MKFDFSVTKIIFWKREKFSIALFRGWWMVLVRRVLPAVLRSTLILASNCCRTPVQQTWVWVKDSNRAIISDCSPCQRRLKRWRWNLIISFVNFQLKFVFASLALSPRSDWLRWKLSFYGTRYVFPSFHWLRRIIWTRFIVPHLTQLKNESISLLGFRIHIPSVVNKD